MIQIAFLHNTFCSEIVAVLSVQLSLCNCCKVIVAVQGAVGLEIVLEHELYDFTEFFCLFSSLQSSDDNNDDNDGNSMKDFYYDIFVMMTMMMMMAMQ